MNAIVVTDKQWAIGRSGDLLFSLPGDMKHFRTLTTGGTVIMGRKTLETFPGGKPLKGRRNIVITRNSDFTRDGCDIVGCYDQALELTVDPEDDDVWVIGGGSVYTALLCRCKRAYLTIIDAVAENSETFFPNLDKLPGWEIKEESEPMTENGITFRFVTYINNKHCDAHIPINPQHLPL